MDTHCDRPPATRPMSGQQHRLGAVSWVDTLLGPCVDQRMPCQELLAAHAGMAVLVVCAGLFPPWCPTACRDPLCRVPHAPGMLRTLLKLVVVHNKDPAAHTHCSPVCAHIFCRVLHHAARSWAACRTGCDGWPGRGPPARLAVCCVLFPRHNQRPCGNCTLGRPGWARLVGVCRSGASARTRRSEHGEWCLSSCCTRRPAMARCVIAGASAPSRYCQYPGQYPGPPMEAQPLDQGCLGVRQGSNCPICLSYPCGSLVHLATLVAAVVLVALPIAGLVFVLSLSNFNQRCMVGRSDSRVLWWF